MKQKLIFFPIFFTFLLLTSVHLYSQNYYGFPAAENSFLGKASASGAGLDINMYTGRLVLNIPLTGVTSKSHTVPVSLSYTGGSGIRHQEYAGVAGLGWQIVAGGNITRVVRGIPDEHPRGYLGAGQHGKSIKNAVTNNTALHQNYFNRITLQNGLRYFDQVYDSEPDLFYVTTPTFSFQFSFDENGAPVVSNQSGITIQSYNFINSSNYVNSYFVVRDDKGFIYYFGNVTTSRNLISEVLCGEQTTYTSTWYLDRIVSTDNNDTVEFTYRRGSTGIERYSNYSWEYTNYFGSSTGDLVENEHTQYMTMHYLRSIVTTTGKIVFDYKLGRIDVEGGETPMISSITTYLNSSAGETMDNKLVFNTSYFGSSASIPSGAKTSDRRRLRLDDIRIHYQENAGTGILFKQFTYSGNNTAYDRKDNSTDYFGYRTSFSSGSDPMKNPSTRKPHSVGVASTYALLRITERSGAYNQIVYGLNTFYRSISQQAEILGGLRVNEIHSYENPANFLKRRFQYEFDGRSSGEVFAQGYDVFSLLASNGTNTIQRTYSSSLSNSTDLNGSYMGYSRVREIYLNNSYSDYFFHNFNHFPDQISNIQSSTNVMFTGGSLAASSISYAHRRGNVSRIETYDDANRKLNDVTYTYEALSSPEGKSSYGVTSRVMGASIGGNSGFSSYSFLYYTPVENYRLTGMTRKEYTPSLNDTTQNLQQVSTYTYHPNKYLIRSTETTDSKGIIMKKTMYYPEDTNIPMLTTNELAVLNTFVAGNMKNLVVHESWQVASNELLQTHYTYNSQYNLEKVANYRRISPEQTDLKISEQEYFYGVPNNRLGAVKQNNGRYNYIRYNAYGQVVAKVDDSAAPTPGLNQMGMQSFFYNGFEDQVTVAKFAGLGSTTSPYRVPFVGDSNRKYVIDFWYLDATRTWKYLKLPYTNNMNLNYGTRIDEVRVYPLDFNLTTITYNTLGMKSSESTSSERTLFYDYDSEKRLSYVLDEDRNILQSYCYNVSGQNIDCFANEEPDYGGFCGVEAAPKWQIFSYQIYNTEVGLNLQFVPLGLDDYYFFSSTQWYTSGITIANLQGTCRPESVMYQQTTMDGKPYEVSIHPNGDIRIRITNMSVPIPTPKPGYFGVITNLLFQ